MPNTKKAKTRRREKEIKKNNDKSCGTAVALRAFRVSPSFTELHEANESNETLQPFREKILFHLFCLLILVHYRKTEGRVTSWVDVSGQGSLCSLRSRAFILYFISFSFSQPIIASRLCTVFTCSCSSFFSQAIRLCLSLGARGRWLSDCPPAPSSGRRGNYAQHPAS